MAIVNDPDVPCNDLRRKVEALGLAPRIFVDIVELMSALVCGARFDLVLSRFRAQKTSWRNVHAVSEALHMPVLLVVQTSEWHAVRAKGSNNRLVDIVSSEVSEIELGWRIDVLLQRAKSPQQEPEGCNISLGSYQFLDAEHIVLHRGQPIRLQPRQFSLAKAIFRNVGRVVSRDWLWASVWRIAAPPGKSRTIDVCIAVLRRKLDLREANGFVLRAAHNRGYILHAIDRAGIGSEEQEGLLVEAKQNYE